MIYLNWGRTALVSGILIICNLDAYTQQRMQKEIGLVVNASPEFGMAYNFGRNDWFGRFRGMAIYHNNPPNINYNVDTVKRGFYDIGMCLSGGLEGRFEMAENAFLKCGLELAFSYINTKQRAGQNQSEIIVSKAFVPALHLVLGAQYNFSKKWMFSAEILPFMEYRIDNQNRLPTQNELFNTLFEFSYGLNLQSLQVSLFYIIQ